MEKKLDTVRKLLAKAERAGTPEEAEIFRAKAMQLIQRYAIDEALLTADHQTGDKIGARRFVVRGWAKPKVQLLAWTADALGCQVIQHTGQSTYGTAVCTAYGWEADLGLLEVLFASLEIQAMREMEIARKARAGGNGQAFTRSFLTGFAHTASQRLKQQRQAAVDERPGTGAELVLVDRSKAVDAHFRQENPRVRTARASSVSAAGAFFAGQAAGRRADLGQGGLGNRRSEIAR